MPFDLRSDFKPTGDQPRAIDELTAGLRRGDRHQVLLGVTGSGKTFTVANVISQVQRADAGHRPQQDARGAALRRVQGALPRPHAVHYFVSYYDYYQPEAYVPSTDTYIEKDSSINDEIDRMRHAATHALLTRNDVIIVASRLLHLRPRHRRGVLRAPAADRAGAGAHARPLHPALVDIQYERNDVDFHRGTFRVRGDTIEVFPPYEEDRAVRIEFFGDEVESIHEIDPLRGVTLAEIDKVDDLPGQPLRVGARDAQARDRRHPRGAAGAARGAPRRTSSLEAQRLEQRTMYDLEMLEQMGFCPGIENYSRWLSGRQAGRSAAVRSSTTSRRTSSSSSTSRT